MSKKKNVWERATAFRKQTNWSNLIGQGFDYLNQVEGICYNWDCQGSDKVIDSNEFTNDLYWDAISESETNMFKLNFKLGLILDVIKRDFGSLDYLYDDGSEYDGTFVDKFNNVFIKVKMFKIETTDNTYSFPDWFKEIEDAGLDTSRYGKLANLAAKLNDAFWVNQKTNKAAWARNNTALQNKIDLFGIDSTDMVYSEKLSAVYEAIRDNVTDNVQVIEFTHDGEAVCNCCGSTKVRIAAKSKFDTHYSATSTDVWKSANSWTIPSNEGVRYVFKDGQLVSSFKDINAFDVDVDVVVDSDELDINVDIDMEIDLDVVVDVIDDESPWSNIDRTVYTDDEDISDSEVFNASVTMCDSDVLGETFDDYNRIMAEQNREYETSKFNMHHEYDYIFDMSSDKAAERNRFLKGLYKCLNSIDKGDLKELEAQYRNIQ